MLGAHLLVTAAETPQYSLHLYSVLVATDSVSAGSWRDCARRLIDAAAVISRAAGPMVGPALAAKYTARAADCCNRAGKAVRP